MDLMGGMDGMDNGQRVSRRRGRLFAFREGAGGTFYGGGFATSRISSLNRRSYNLVFCGGRV